MKKISRLFPIVALLLATSLIFTSCQKDDEDNNPANMPEEKSIATIASEDPQFSILVDALVKADLVSTLDGNGTFTVFAPTNDAFNELFQTLGVNGIEDLTKEALTPILLYHVVGLEAKSTDLATGYIETLSADTEDGNGIVMYVEVGTGVQINKDVTVTNADIDASNGVIHVVNKVILPPTVVDIAIQNPGFSTLVEAVVKAGLVEALMAPGPFTVFAPTNEAFDNLFAALQINGIEDLTADDLTPILLYHVVQGNILAAEVPTAMVPTLNDAADLDIVANESGVSINGSTNVIATDVQGSNGVVHVIDAVLVPSTK
jgi:transforming growth factor-beta-induced protein